MGDIAVRLAAVAVAGLAVAVFAYMLRRIRDRPRRLILLTGLQPGAYLFTSGDCGECARARSSLAEALGPAGFTEIPWESEPGIFQRLDVSAVPSTLIVAADGSGVWHAGVPRNP